MTRAHTPRRGFTLIELLVVMAIIGALSLLALMLLPGVTNSDAALKATEEVRATGKIAQALAAGARAPRGVRFLVQPGAPLGTRYATELQLIEAPPVTVLDPMTLVAQTNNPTGVLGPRVEITYTLYNGTETSIDPTQSGVTPPQGAIKSRNCNIFSLTQDQAAQVQTGAMLALPTMGFWSRVLSASTPSASNPAVDGAGVNRYDVNVVLDVYPDTYMGASTFFRTYHAGIYGPAVPLLGQPTIPLPNKTGVDLDISVPPIRADASGNLTNYDVLFAPDGQTISVSGRSTSAGVYLWVRDVTKLVNPNPVNGGANTSMWAGDLTRPTHFPNTTAWADAFRRGGEQHAVGINNGFIGTAPIQWPQPDGTYPVGTGDPFTFARKRLQ